MSTGKTTPTSTAIVTGGGTGLGYHAAASLATDQRWAVVLAVRDLARGNAAASSIRRRTGNSNVSVLHLDLASLASVRAFSGAVARAGLPPVRGLVCNAGVQIVRGTRQTLDGFEETFAVNHLGHFLLVALLLPQLAAPARIVVVSSGTHDPDRWTGMPPARFQSPEVLADPGASGGHRESTSLRGRRRYTTSKLCNILFAYELDRRLREVGQDAAVSVNVFDPGAMPGTGLARDWPAPMRAFWNSIMPVAVPMLRRLGLPFSSARRSGALLARVVTGAEYAGTSGEYLELGRETRSSKASYDRQQWTALWDASVKMVRLKRDESPLVTV